MESNRTWTPYFEKMLELLGSLSLTEITEWEGTKPASLLNDAGAGTLKAFQSEKADKICLGSFRINSSLHYGLCTIFPRQGLDLPLFLSRWEEGPSEIVHLVDLPPTVDTLVDEAYRKKYIEPMDPSWDRFAALAGICPEENDVIRSICSIIYTAARAPIEKKGQRLAALAPHADYLKHYIGYMQAAAPEKNADKQAEIIRKTDSLRRILRGQFRSVFSGPLSSAFSDDGIGKAVSLLF